VVGAFEISYDIGIRGEERAASGKGPYLVACHMVGIQILTADHVEVTVLEIVWVPYSAHLQLGRKSRHLL
jgi:hypothetical protein